MGKNIIKPNPVFIISRTDNIGDVVLTLPVAGILKQKYPQSTIWFIGKTYTEPIINLCENIDYFLNYDELKSLKETEIIEKIRQINADIFIHVFPDKLLAKVASRAKIPLRIGTMHRSFHWFRCNRLPNFSRKNSNLHEAQLNLKLIESIININDFPLECIHKYYGLHNASPLKNEIISLMDNNKVKLILHPRSKGSAREWGPDNYSRLINILPPDKYQIFITGTKDEGNSLKNFLDENSGRVIDLTGKLTLRELISFINQSDCLIAASTGVLHIAAALGKSVIGLYAPIRPIFPRRWAPLGENAEFLVQGDENCSLCTKNTNCQCISGIKPETVSNILTKKYI
ncbi:MAG: glycosyltransferase family 9 protein [Bacteroidota bacterium]|nr:glycosyltransferase family 9 protein [Bacteroidota bacterium]